MSTGYPLQTELRHSQNREDGKALYGDIDNKSYGAMTTLTIGGHGVGQRWCNASGHRRHLCFAGYAFICETENGFMKWPFIYSKEQR
ncbi:TPA: OprD family outer membrane porin [Klebsiella variicola]|nr:OprD family outer membrane porin [Klebsiella variicola]HCD6352155.1 OprD family outer membrane porin [Klebsiella variicola]HDK6082617.1 OprD family outer membrane porin [Klebsiella variicola]